MVDSGVKSGFFTTLVDFNRVTDFGLITYNRFRIMVKIIYLSP